MNFRKILLLPLFIVCLSGCNSSSSSNSPDLENYLQLGNAMSSDEFFQTFTEFNYVQPYSSDPNQASFELVFDLRYIGTKVLPFSVSCEAVFDGDKNLGGYSFIKSGSMPSSVAPSDSFTVKLGFDCFKDWEKVYISCSYSEHTSFSFMMRSSDFVNPTNNLYPALKAGESVTTTDGVATIRVGGIQRTSVGSAYAGTDDNVLATFTVTNNTNQKITYNTLSFNFDNGFSSGHISWSSGTQPTSVEANSFVSFGVILIIQSTWKTCVVETTFNLKTTLKFNLNHSDYNY